MEAHNPDDVVVKVDGKEGDIVKLDDEGNAFIPEVTSNEDFYVYNHSLQPEVDPDLWVMDLLDGGTEQALIDKAFLDTLPLRQIELTLQCIGSGPSQRLINNAVWGGLPLVEVMDVLGVPLPGPDKIELKMSAPDGYHASIPIEDLTEAPVWLIWEMNGVPLPARHGGPARLMVPGRYGIKNVKWITRVEFIDYVHAGYWDLNGGWSHTGEYKLNGFIMVPSYGSEVSAPVKILGTAFAGGDRVVRVELTDDGGVSWRRCQIDYAPGADRWVLGSFEWSPRPGTHEIQIRATSASGQVTNMDPAGSNRLDGYDAGMLIPLTVVG